MTQCNAGGEAARLEALYRYDILDTEPEEAFERITRLVKSVLQMPMAVVSLVDRDRQWFKSRQGVQASETQRDISFCTHTIQDTQPLIVPDALADPRFAESPIVLGEPRIRFYAGVPLRTKDGYNLGALCSMDTKARELSCEQLDLLQDLAQLVVDEIELRLLASTDSLTGALSRRAFIDQASGDIARSQRHHTPLSCVVLDIDHFKTVNDTYGHAVGDLVLQRLTAVCKEELHDGEYLGRLGGEEFAVMLPQTPLVGAAQNAERLRKAVAAEEISYAGKRVRVTASIGVAEYTEHTDGIENLLHMADSAMYDAKLDGRNQVNCFLSDDLLVSDAAMLPAAAV
jgi:diguanylate cyclase (GGDEF)-like protein